jgi:hypothetical protein
MNVQFFMRLVLNLLVLDMLKIDFVRKLVRQIDIIGSKSVSRNIQYTCTHPNIIYFL